MPQESHNDGVIRMEREKIKAQIRAAKVAGAKIQAPRNLPKPDRDDIIGAIVIFALLAIFVI